jgi:hypothetical protein
MNDTSAMPLSAHIEINPPIEEVPHRVDAPLDSGGAESEKHREHEAPSEKVRRISAELTGDMAVEADLISTMLRIDEKGRSKIERDTLLVELGIQSINAAIEQWRKETGRKFPDHEDMRRYLLGS